MIVIKDLHKTYTSGSSTITALNDINLTIDKGDIFGIIGFSGAGKSSLIRCLNRLESLIGLDRNRRQGADGSVWQGAAAG